MIQTKETVYNGYRFRSRLEARWAVFLDALNIRYEYEKEGYILSNGGSYLPDFWLPDIKTWVEIKPRPEYPTPPIYLYLAGKMSDWRESLDLRGHMVCGPDQERKAHNVMLHGQGTSDQDDIIESCLDGIRQANTVFAWINSTDCYGTLIELGYAKALNKPIWVAMDTKLDTLYESETLFEISEHGTSSAMIDDMWFVKGIATHFYGIYTSPNHALQQLLPPLTEAEQKCLRLSKEYPCWLVQGDPYPDQYSITNFYNERIGIRNQQFCWWPTYTNNMGGREYLALDGPLFRRSRSRHIEAAYNAARQARFEFGETPRLTPIR